MIDRFAYNLTITISHATALRYNNKQN